MCESDLHSYRTSMIILCNVDLHFERSFKFLDGLAFLANDASDIGRALLDCFGITRITFVRHSKMKHTCKES